MLCCGRRPVSQSPSPFPDTITDPQRHARELALSPAAIRYAMHFTPRSGSSWVGDIATRTGKLGNPGEPFNLPHVEVVAARLNATDLDSYIDKPSRVRNTGGIFGFQLTYGHIATTFGGPAAYMRHFRNDPTFWLIREDIVGQAVSLSKKAQTRIGHTIHQRAAADRDAGFDYDTTSIIRFLTHLELYEQGTERLFAKFGLDPLRLSYERMTQLKPIEVAQVIARHVGRPDLTFDEIESEHAKLGTSLNSEFAERFRAEHPELVAKIEDKRHHILKRLQPLDALRSGGSA